jgi:hypothetical protein
VSALTGSGADHARTILEQVASGKHISQRSLARESGIALGLANLLVRRMARRGWVRMVRLRPNRIRYLITPAGAAEIARRSRAHLADSMSSYAQARDRIAQRLCTLSAEWCNRGADDRKRIVFLGGGEEAEIGYVCLQQTDLELVGVVDGCGGKRFFGRPVSSLDALAPGRLGDLPFDVLVVMSFGDEKKIRRQLSAAAYPISSVFWI